MTNGYVLQVGEAKEDALTNQLIDYLMGESDGMPKVVEPIRTAYLLSTHSIRSYLFFCSVYSTEKCLSSSLPPTLHACCA